MKLYTEAGTVVVNGRPLEEISEGTFISKVVTEPFDVTKTAGQFRVMAKVSGGGFSSQSEAIRHGIARALTLFDPELRKPLKKAGLLTRDPREKERKKYGLKRARKAEQYSKR